MIWKHKKILILSKEKKINAFETQKQIGTRGYDGFLMSGLSVA
jgi:hypothetical protein